jgi:hypothetical protein
MHGSGRYGLRLDESDWRSQRKPKPFRQFGFRSGPGCAAPKLIVTARGTGPWQTPSNNWRIRRWGQEVKRYAANEGMAALLDPLCRPSSSVKRSRRVLGRRPRSRRPWAGGRRARRTQGGPAGGLRGGSDRGVRWAPGPALGLPGGLRRELASGEVPGAEREQRSGRSARAGPGGFARSEKTGGPLADVPKDLHPLPADRPGSGRRACRWLGTATGTAPPGGCTPGGHRHREVRAVYHFPANLHPGVSRGVGVFVPVSLQLHCLSRTDSAHIHARGTARHGSRRLHGGRARVTAARAAASAARSR